jgi:hypothetical protein
MTDDPKADDEGQTLLETAQAMQGSPRGSHLGMDGWIRPAGTPSS